MSRWTWSRKKIYWEKLNLTIATPSRWMAECAKASSLFGRARLRVLPNGIDTGVYKPIDRFVARQVLNLPPDKKLILTGALGLASDPVKGFDYLQKAVSLLAEMRISGCPELLVFGTPLMSNSPKVDLKTHYLGMLHDDTSLAMIYSAADVFVAPSIHENLPNTIMESMACGTPCVAFNIGGIPDMIDHNETGYLAKPFHADDLANGIVWVLSDDERRRALSFRSRKKVERDFAIEKVARSYMDLYEEILSGRSQK